MRGWHALRRAALTAVILAAAILGTRASAQMAPHAATEALAYRLEVRAPGQDPVSLYIEERGSGPPLVLLHGLAASSYVWRRIAPELARSHHVITIDLKGFGRSDKPFDLAYSAADQAALVAAFLAQRGLRNVTLAGHSFGGQVALVAAIDLDRRDPGRISRLVLMDAPVYPQPFSSVIEFLRQPVLPYVALTVVPVNVHANLAFALQKGRFDHLTSEDVSAYARPYEEAGARHALIATARQIVPANHQELMRAYYQLALPTLIVWCREDEVVPLSTGLRLSRVLPKARMALIERCNHVPQEEAPDDLLWRLHTFLAQ